MEEVFSGCIVKIEPQNLRIARRLFRAKRSRRRALAALSFPEKINILIRLQTLAREVYSATGRACPPPWKNSD
jgi:hypothetical protein